MNTGADPTGNRVTSRRDFVSEVGVGIALAALAPQLPLAVLQSPESGSGVGNAGDGVNTLRPVPVVSFHLDQPYLDVTGRGVPYLPPRAFRSGQYIADLSEHAFRSAYPYL
jgi:hypothetical protein